MRSFLLHGQTFSGRGEEGEEEGEGIFRHNCKLYLLPLVLPLS